MKKKTKSMMHMATMVVCIGVAAMTLGLSGCKKDDAASTPEPEPEPELQGTLRYEPVPYVETAAKSIGRAEDIKIDNLVHSAFDSESCYYLFLLGHVNNVPIAFRDAISYNGVTPITVGYSHSNTSETSIGSSATTAIENTVGKNQEVNYGVSATIGAKAPVFHASVTASAGGSTSWNSSNTRSVSNTVETTMTKTEGNESSMEMTIGDNNEPIGKYRFALFGTTDVYYVLVTSKGSPKVIKESYIAVCARPGSYAWGVDYEPDLGGSFARTMPGDLLQVPVLDLTSLPTPTSNDISVILPPAKPKASLKGGEYTIGSNSMNVRLSSTNNGVVYYTTDGSTPTKNSVRYDVLRSIKIPIGKTTLKAIAISGSQASDIMTETYTVTRGRETKEETFTFNVSASTGLFTQVRGDLEIDSKDNKTTSWELEVDIRENGSNAIADFTYTVREGGGKSDASILKFTRSMILPLNKTNLEIETPKSGVAVGSFTGERHGNYIITPPSNTPFTSILVTVDGKGKDKENCKAAGYIKVKYSFIP